MNNSEKIVKERFNWEVPVEQIPLPSTGVVYSPYTVMYHSETVNIRSMTAHEEDILSSQAYIKEGVAIIKLLESCLTDKTINVMDLIAGDRNALMIAIRITGYGADYPIKHSCDGCGKVNKVNVDLTSLPIKRFKVDPVAKGKNLFEFKLPITGKKVVFKYVTAKDEVERDLTAKRLKHIGVDTSQNAVTKLLEDVIVSIDDVTDKTVIQHFIRNMPAMDSRKLRLFIKENEAGIDMTTSYHCENCGHQNNLIMPVNSEFFWPST